MEPFKQIMLTVMVLFGILFIFFQYRARKKEKILKQIKRSKNKKNYLLPFTVLFSQSPLFKKSFDKIRQRIRLVYPADIVEINTRVTRDMLISYGIALGIGCLFFLIAGDDAYYYIMGVYWAYVAHNHINNFLYERADQKILEQLYRALSTIRHNYYVAGKKIDDAIYLSIDECPYEISLHLDRIHKILTSIDMHREVDKYISIAPNHFLLDFVAITSSVMEYGDKELPDGNSMMLNNIAILKDAVHAEQENIKRNNALFSGRTFIAILSVLFIKPVQIWAKSVMPEIWDFYIGMTGRMVEVGIFLASIWSYRMVMGLKDRGLKEIKEHNLLHKMSNYRFVSAILTKEANRNFSKTQRFNDKLKLTGENMGYKQFLLKRAIYAACFFFGFQLLVLFSQWQERHNLLTNFSNSFQSSHVSDEAVNLQMQQVAITYMNSKKSFNHEMDKEKLAEEIIRNTNVKKPLLAEMIVDALIEKSNTYNNVYYRWYFLFIGIFLMFIGFQVPKWLLNNRIKAIRSGMEDEVNQYQTIVMLLMHVDGMSIQIILEWIERFAYCFQESIQTCINELPYNEEIALKNLRDSEAFESFKRFINNMLIVNEQGLVAAFEEIVKERENNLEARKSDKLIIGQKKANKATLICLVPLAVWMIGYLIYPLYLLSENMLGSIGL